MNRILDLQGLRLAIQTGRRTDPFDVEIPGASAGENQAWTKTLRRHVGACGCELGALALALALVALLLSQLVFDTSLSVLGWIGVAFGAVLSGKLLGLGWSRLALRRLERDVARRVEAAAG